jgi:toxin ParE1/3/4
MRIVWSADAMEDLLAIRHYNIADYHPEAAIRTAETILHSANLLLDHPLLGRPLHRPTMRKLVIKNSVYSILYQVKENEILVLEVFDGRQKKPRILPE